MSMVAICRAFFLCSVLALSPLSHAADPAPDFRLPGDTAPLALSDLKGEVIFLDFWASWCTPCRQSFPWMNEMQQRYGEKGFRVIAVNLDKDRSLVARFRAEIKPQFAILYDDGKVAESYGVQAMPSSYLIDRHGRIVTRHMGFRTDEAAAMEQAIADLVNAREK